MRKVAKQTVGHRTVSVLTIAAALAMATGAYGDPATGLQPPTTSKQHAHEPDRTPAPSPAGVSNNTEPTTTLQQIQVVGLRASAESAVDRQRFSSQIQESIVAQNIGKLPDTNAADALSRLPGVQITQDEGEGSTVSIRGITQIETLLNGSPIFTAGTSRLLNFEDIPAGILSGATVYKDPVASQVEGGIGGIVDLRTHRPFDFSGKKAFVSVGATNASLAAKTKPKANFLFSNIWHVGGGKFGALIAGSFAQRPLGQILAESNYVSYFTGTALNGQTATKDSPLIYGPGLFFDQIKPGTRTREGLNTSFEWQPNDRFQLQLNTYSAYFKEAQTADELRIDTSVPGPLSEKVPSLHPGTASLFSFEKLPGTDDLMTGTFLNAATDQANRNVNEYDKLNNIALSANWRISESFSLSAKATTTESVHHDVAPVLEIGAVIPKVTESPLSKLPKYALNGFNAADPENYQWTNAEYDLEGYSGHQKAIRIDAKYRPSAGVLDSLDFGYRYQNRTEINNSLSFDHEFTPNGEPVIGGVPDGIDAATTPDLLSVEGSPYGPLLVPKVALFTDPQGAFSALGIGTLPGFDPASFFSGGQRTDAAYAVGYFHFDGPIPVDANVGVRYVHTKNHLVGTLTSGKSLTPISVNGGYGSVLPTLNVTAHLTGKLQARFAANKTIARPSFSDLSPSTSLDELRKTGKTGNPFLKPFTSTGYDLALEWFPEQGADLFGDVFYKTFQNSIVDLPTFTDINGSEFLLTKPVNQSRGFFRGVEAGYQQFFTHAPGLLRYTGVNLSYTYVHSNVPGVVKGFVTPVEDMSRDSYDIEFMFDIPEHMWARIAWNWRSGFFAGTETAAISPVVETIPFTQRPFGQLDASFGYFITPKLEISVDGVNVTNTVEQNYFVRETQPFQNYFEDKRVTMNLSYNFF